MGTSPEVAYISTQDWKVNLSRNQCLLHSIVLMEEMKVEVGIYSVIRISFL